MKTLSMILAALLLSDCSLAPGGSQASAVAEEGLVKAVRDVKQFNDGAMQLGLDVLCAPSVGAYFRLPSGNQKTSVRLACDPSAPVVVLPETPPAQVMVETGQPVEVPRPATPMALGPYIPGPTAPLAQ